MNTTTYYKRPIRHAAPYPNAATRRQVWQKLLDLALLIASGVGIGATVMMLLILL